MGLDNGFQLRNKKTGKTIDLFHFRKYYELAEYFRSQPMLPKFDGSEGASYEYAVTKDFLQTLQHQLDPIYTELVKLPSVAYCDDNGYPKKYTKLFYNHSFDPTDSQSSFAGQKLMRLYNRIDALLEILDMLEIMSYNSEAEYEIIFYDSF